MTIHRIDLLSLELRGRNIFAPFFLEHKRRTGPSCDNTRAHAILFIVSICCLLIAGAGYVRPFLQVLEPTQS